MIVLLSPTKTQKPTQRYAETVPVFASTSKGIRKTLMSWDVSAITSNYKVSSKLASSIYTNLHQSDSVYPALFCYQGSSFKSLKPESWSQETLIYSQSHLVIFSALYGCLKPLDAIALYRLDFMTRFPENLYTLWQKKVTDYLSNTNEPLINLASQEYSAMIDRESLKSNVIDIDFKEFSNGTYISKATYSKIARGSLAKIILENKIKSLTELRAVCFDGYSVNESLSNDFSLVFTR